MARETGRRERRRAEIIAGAAIVAAVGAGAAVETFLLAHYIEAAPLWLSVLYEALPYVLLVSLALLIVRRILGRRGMEIALFGKYFERQCEVCGEIHRGNTDRELDKVDAVH